MSNGEGTKDLGGDEKRRPADRALFTENCPLAHRPSGLLHPS